MTDSEKQSHLARMCSEEHKKTLELAAIRESIDRLLLTPRRHRGTPDPIHYEDRVLLNDILDGRIVPYPHAANYLFNVRMGR